MIINVEAESLYFECKAPSDPKVGKDTRVHLAKACSGFANTNGGILLYGISTTKHSHSGLDVMTQLEPVGSVKSFAQQIDNSIPSLSTPAPNTHSVKVIKEKPNATRGVVLVHIPKTVGDPVQSNIDNLFYFRSGDDFVVAPYEMIKRLFAATESPDLIPKTITEILKPQSDGTWHIPIVLENLSSAIAEYVNVFLRVKNPELFTSLSCDFHDNSAVNPGSHKTFIYQMNDAVIHKGLGTMLGHLRVKFKPDDPTRGVVPFELSLYANKMPKKSFRVAVNIKDGGLSSFDVQADN